MLPSIIFPGASTKPITEKPVIDFPEPDSPTSPTISPATISKLTPSTAFKIPAFVKKCVCRLLIFKIGSNACLTFAGEG